MEDLDYYSLRWCPLLGYHMRIAVPPDLCSLRLALDRGTKDGTLHDEGPEVNIVGGHVSAWPAVPPASLTRGASRLICREQGALPHHRLPNLELTRLAARVCLQPFHHSADAPETRTRNQPVRLTPVVATTHHCVVYTIAVEFAFHIINWFCPNPATSLIA